MAIPRAWTGGDNRAAGGIDPPISDFDADLSGADAGAGAGAGRGSITVAVGPVQRYDVPGWAMFLLLACAPEPIPAETADTGEIPTLDLDGDGWDITIDCDDLDPAVFPGASEICNDLDDDCDDVVDEGFVKEGWYDLDGDGYGGEPGVGCGTWLPSGGDCDDAHAAAHPGADDVCDGLDNDCDGDVDQDFEGGLRYTDADGDGYGTGEARVQCDGAFVAGDCDDYRYNTNPDGEETCDPGDADCDGIDVSSARCGTMEASDAEQTFYGLTGTDFYALSTRNVADLDGDGRMELIRRPATWDGSLWVIPLSDEARWEMDPAGFTTIHLGLSAGGGLDVGEPYGDGPILVTTTTDRDVVLLRGTVEDAELTDQMTAVVDLGGSPWTSGTIVGDLDGDGLDEVLATTRIDETVWVGVYFGGPTGTVDAEAADWVLESRESQYSLSDAGDLDGDGRDDVVAIASSGSTTDASLYLGEASSSDPRISATWTAEGSVLSDFSAVAPCGDLLGDGGCTAISSPYLTIDEADEVTGTVYLASSALATGAHALEDDALRLTPEDQCRFGHAMAAGDFNADGHTDLAVSSPLTDRDDVQDRGEVHVFYGPIREDRPASHAGVRIRGTEDDGWLGLELQAADLDGDGADDILASTGLDGTSTGALRIFRGWTD